MEDVRCPCCFSPLIPIPLTLPPPARLVKSSPFLSLRTEAKVLSPLFNTVACQTSFQSQGFLPSLQAFAPEKGRLIFPIN